MREKIGRLLCTLGFHEYSKRVVVQSRNYYACSRCKKIR